MTLTVFDHESACDESMPPGTRTLVTTDIGGAMNGRPMPVRGGVTYCSPTCETLPGATLELDPATFTGVLRFTYHGQAKAISFRALSCATPGGREMLCG